MQDVRALASVIGEEELGDVDQKYLKFGRAFEREFVNQALTENRTIEQTLDIGWQLLSMLPKEELTRVSLDEIKTILQGRRCRKLNVAPTRTNLIRIKKELQLRAGRLRDPGPQARGADRRSWSAWRMKRMCSKRKSGSCWKQPTAPWKRHSLTLGSDHVEWAALAANKTVDVHLKLRGIMGVAIPVIEAQRRAGKDAVQPERNECRRLDEASAAFREVLIKTPQLSMLVTTVWRLAGELRKTQRRVNALQHIFIPRMKRRLRLLSVHWRNGNVKRPSA